MDLPHMNLPGSATPMISVGRQSPLQVRQVRHDEQPTERENTAPTALALITQVQDEVRQSVEEIIEDATRYVTNRSFWAHRHLQLRSPTTSFTGSPPPERGQMSPGLNRDGWYSPA